VADLSTQDVVLRLRAIGAAATAGDLELVKKSVSGLNDKLAKSKVEQDGWAAASTKVFSVAGKAAQGYSNTFDKVTHLVTANFMKMAIASAIFVAAVAIVGLAVGAVAGFAGIVGLKFDAMKETAVASLTKLTGSAAQAQKTWGSLVHFANTTPFDVQSLATTDEMLLAAGFHASELIPLMTRIGDASAAIGTGTVGATAIAKTFGQIRKKGTLNQSEVSQLATEGIPVEAILEKAYNVNGATLAKAMSAGLIGGNAAINVILDGMNSRFHGAMMMQANTIGQIWSNVKGSVEAALGTIYAPALPALKRLGSFLVDFMNQSSGSSKNAIASMVGGVAKVTSWATAEIIRLYHWLGDPNREGVTGAQRIGDAMTDTWSRVKTAFAWLQTHWPAISSALVGIAAGAWAIVQHGAALVGFLGKFAGLFGLDAKQATEFLVALRLLNPLISGLAGVLPTLIKVAPGVVGALAFMTEAFFTLGASETFALAPLLAVGTVAAVVVAAIVLLGAGLIALWHFSPKFRGEMQAIAANFRKIVSEVERAVGAIERFLGKSKTAKAILGAIWAVVSFPVIVALDQIFGLLTVVTDLLGGQWGKAWKDAKKMVSNIFDDLVNALEKVYHGLASILGLAGVTIGTAKSGGTNLLSGPMSPNQATMMAFDYVRTNTPGAHGPGRAYGGMVGPGERHTLVGEFGPERVTLPVGSKVQTAAETRGASDGQPIIVQLVVSGSVLASKMIDGVVALRSVT